MLCSLYLEPWQKQNHKQPKWLGQIQIATDRPSVQKSNIQLTSSPMRTTSIVDTSFTATAFPQF